MIIHCMKYGNDTAEQSASPRLVVTKDVSDGGRVVDLVVAVVYEVIQVLVFVVITVDIPVGGFLLWLVRLKQRIDHCHEIYNPI